MEPPRSPLQKIGSITELTLPFPPAPPLFFAGIGQIVSGSQSTIFRKVTINTGSIVTINTNTFCNGASSVWVINGTLNPDEATDPLLMADSIAVNSGGVLKVNAALFNQNYQVAKPLLLNSGSIVEYASTSKDQTISSDFTYSTLRISGSGRIKKLAADLPLLRSTSSSSGNIYVLSGTLDLRSFLANRATGVSGGVISVSNGATLKIGGNQTFPGGYTTVTLPLSSTVEYSGSSQAVAGRTYGNLVLSSEAGASVKTMPTIAFTVSGSLTSSASAGASVYFSAASNITVSGSFNIGASTTFNGDSFTCTVYGNWNNNGNFDPATSTIRPGILCTRNYFRASAAGFSNNIFYRKL